MLSRVIANNDIAYLWWRVTDKIPGCLGFSIRRIGDDGLEKALPAYVGFAPGTPGQPHRFRDTDAWPIQSFQWKDVFAKPGTYRYRIIPMLGPDVDALVADEANAHTTDAVAITGNYGDVQAYFNVGLISTQSVARRIRKLVEDGVYPNRLTALQTEIATPGSPIRKSLAGDVLQQGLLALPNRALADSGVCNMSLYELTDRELIDTIKTLAENGKVDLCLANADKTEKYTGDDGKEHSKKIKDGTNAKSRAELIANDVPLTNRFVPSSNIGHNKFVVYSSGGKNRTVLSGSTNWTSTGLCSQTNNALLITNPTIADGYSEYWQRLVDDAALDPAQGADLREWCGSGAIESALDEGQVSVWFSPNTKRKTKGDETPPDLQQVFDLIQGAQKGILFLAFNPGTPSCLEKISEKAEQKRDAGEPFFVRGAVTDPTPLGNFATFVTKRNTADAPDVLVTGVGGIPDDYSNWEKELYKIGHAVIHDKIIVIDPFTPECVVVTGSHNLGFKASYQNDENLVIVRGHRRLAEAYATHVLDVTNHFNWRAKLTKLNQQNRLDEAWGDLDETDRWQDKYFGDIALGARDAFFFE